MDFFATGGFQQLFSDLNDTQLHGNWTDLSADMDSSQTFPSYDYCAQPPIESNDSLMRLAYEYDPFALDGSTIEQTLLELSADWSEVPAESRCSNSNDNSVSMEYHDWNIINDKELQLTLDQLLGSPAAVTCEAVKDGESLASLPHSTYNNVSIPDSIDSTTVVGLETAAFNTREMAEWEDKFLDNYIEIPELIDFLPENTPLCIETCEHFLDESSKNLKLHHKMRGVKRSNESVISHEERTAAGYPCTFGTCDKIYTKLARLKTHLRRHMGEKPYRCYWPNCTLKFSRSDELARHRRLHSGVKPYECNYCVKCFTRSDHLANHRKVHERRLLAAHKAGKTIDGVQPHSVLTVRPGRKRKNQI